MAFTRALYTSLSVWGAPGPAPASLYESQSTTDTVSVSVGDVSALAVLTPISTSDTVSITVTEVVGLQSFDQNANRTELRATGLPGSILAIGDKAPQIILPVTVFDTLSVQWNEDPVSQNYIISGDNLRVSVGDSSSFLNYIAVFDTLAAKVSENIALVQVGVTLITTTDILAVQVTDTSSVSVAVAVTDTVSASVTDTSSLSTTVTTITTTDTLFVRVADASLLSVFTGVLTLNVSDTLVVQGLDSSALETSVPTKPERIRIFPRTAHIRITPL